MSVTPNTITPLAMAGIAMLRRRYYAQRIKT
jgi:hypothetical protein